MQNAIDTCYQGVPGRRRLGGAAQIFDDAAVGELPICRPIGPRAVLGWKRRWFVTFAPTAGDRKPDTVHT